MLVAAISSSAGSPSTSSRVLAVANQKGGVGKTTSTVNLAAGLALQGLRTLVIDLDPQGNASTALGIEHRAGTRSVYEVLLGELRLADAVAVTRATRVHADVRQGSSVRGRNGSAAQIRRSLQRRGRHPEADRSARRPAKHI